MKAVMLSVRPNWCAKITNKIGIEKNGKPIYEKTVEVRKTRPKIETPFKCFIYETNWIDNTYWKNRHKGKLGKVIGEFVCDRIEDMRDIEQDPTCLSIEEWLKYTDGHKGIVYGWHISDLVIYDKPKELGEFYHYCGDDPKCDGCKYLYSESNESVGLYEECCSPVEGCKTLTRPPQSWCYVEVQE